MPTASQIEQAIIGRLAGELPYIRTLGSISEFLSRDIGVIEEIAPLCPAAYVIYGRGKFSQKMSGWQDREMVFGVIVVVRNLRGDSAVRHGAGDEKGIYEVLEDVRAALSNQSCGVDMDPLAPLSEEAVAGGRDFAVYEILFTTRCRFAL
ncbi:MAG: phage protein Gp37 [Syntrophobacteraceae bacterium]